MSWPFVIAGLGGLLLGLRFKPPAVAAVSAATMAWVVWLWVGGSGIMPAVAVLVALQAAYLAGVALRLVLRDRRRPED